MAEVKKNKKTSGVKNYFRDVKMELKKVTWLTREELTKYTITVLVMTGLFAILVFLFDKAIIFLLSKILQS